MDGSIHFNDSYKPAIIAANNRHRATVAIMEDQIIITPRAGAAICEVVNAEGVLTFRLVPEAEAGLIKETIAENAEAISTDQPTAETI